MTSCSHCLNFGGVSAWKKTVFYSSPGKLEMTGLRIAVFCFGLLLIVWGYLAQKLGMTGKK
jgi:hypothetical protein